MATNTADVQATRSLVYGVLADGWSYSSWVVGASHMRAVEADWPARGTKIFHCAGVWPVALRDQTQVEVCEAQRRLVLIASGRPFGQARIELVLDDIDSGCRVTMHETPVSGPGRWAHNPIGESVLHRRNTEALARLTALCERHTAPA